MIDGLKHYLATKDSDVPWFGQLPSHWTLRRIKTLFREKDERSGDGSGTLLSLTRSRGLLPHSEASSRPASADDLSHYKRCAVGDLVMNRMQAWSGMFAIASVEGLVSPDYSVFVRIEAINAEYYLYLFKTPLFVDQFAQQSKGIGSGFNRLYTPDFGAIPAVFPPLNEQDSIVRFLHNLDRRIRNYIRAKQKLIELLEEQKQAIIQRAVTRGLDPNVRFEPSDAQWLPNIPKHWKMSPLKRAFDSMDYGISESTEEEGTIRVLTMGNIRGGKVSIPQYGGVQDVDPALLLQPGDLLFNRTNSAELVGKVGLFRGAPMSVTFASYLVRLRCNPHNVPEYLNFLLNAPAFLEQVRRESIPSLHQSNLNPTRYGRFLIPLPDRSEQLSIVKFLESRTCDIERAIDDTSREILALREYRTRLVANVVTGKLDVRTAAAKMCEEQPGTETPEEADAVIEAEDSVENEIETVSEEAEA